MEIQSYTEVPSSVKKTIKAGAGTDMGKEGPLDTANGSVS